MPKKLAKRNPGRGPYYPRWYVIQELGISPSTLKRRMKDGSLKRNHHYRHSGNPDALRPHYRFHLARLRKDLGYGD